MNSSRAQWKSHSKCAMKRKGSREPAPRKKDTQTMARVRRARGSKGMQVVEMCVCVRELYQVPWQVRLNGSVRSFCYPLQRRTHCETRVVRAAKRAHGCKRESLRACQQITVCIVQVHCARHGLQRKYSCIAQLNKVSVRDTEPLPCVTLKKPCGEKEACSKQQTTAFKAGGREAVGARVIICQRETEFCPFCVSRRKR